MLYVFCINTCTESQNLRDILPIQVQNVMSLSIVYYSLTMNVLTDPPKIEVTFEEHKPHRELRCKPSGVPSNYTFKEWEHRTEYNQLIRRLPNNSSVLNLQYIKGESDRHHDRGIYVCQASNNVIMNGSLFTSGEMFLQAQGAYF